MHSGGFLAARQSRAGFDLLKLRPCAGNLLDDVLDRGRPDEGLRIFVPGAQELIDRALQMRHAHEAAPTYRLIGQFSEPTLYQIQPARTGRNKVTDEARMLLQPSLHMRLFVRAVVVHDQMELECGGKFPIKAAQESQPLLMSVPSVTFTDDLAVQEVERCKERRGAVALVIVRHRAAATFLQRQARLSAIQGLNLALLVQAQHQSFLRWIQIQPDNVGQFLQKFRIPRELKSTTQMRLEIVQLPQPIYRIFAHPLRLCHRPATPMRHARGLALQRSLNDALPRGSIVSGFSSSTRGDLPNLANAPLVHPLAPQLHRDPIHFKLLGNCYIALTGQRSQNNPAAQRHLLRRAVRALPTLKLSSFSRSQLDRQTSIWHERIIAIAGNHCISIYATLH